MLHPARQLPLAWALTLAPLMLLAQSGAQSPLGGLPSKPAPKAPPTVSYLFPEQVTIAADKSSSVDLHFRVAAGLHIQSHTPTEPELIPTTLTFADSSVRLQKTEFPKGTPYSFPTDPQQKLSVYTGDFTVHAQLLAARGNHLVQGTLHYQACSNEICLPPRSIPVAIDVIAK